MIDLDRYFARIGYTGPRAATLAALQSLHALHPAVIPFENFSPLLSLPVPLDLAALQEKLVASKRGGYCFEQNTLFRAALEALGFKVTPYSGRVLWMKPRDAPPGPRAHMLLRVDLPEGPYIADVGFGGYLAAAPLKLVADAEQATPAGVMRFAREGEGWLLQARLGSDWQNVYYFTTEASAPVDYEVANWFTSTHPSSLFRQNLLLQRVLPDARLSLFNRRVTRRFFDGRMEETMLASPDDFTAVLRGDFGLEPPGDLAALFARLPAAA